MYFSSQALINKFPLSLFWVRLSVLGILSSYFYVTMEWLFFVTKPSFMDAMDGTQKIDILFTTGAILAVLSILAVFIFFGLDILLPILFSKSSKFFLYTAAIFPALILATLAVLLIDNFTYTVFKFGIVSTRGMFRIVYILILLLMLLYFYRWGLRFIGFSRKTGGGFKLFYILSSLLLLVSAVFMFQRFKPFASPNTPLLQGKHDYPNILILGSDGVNATNLSIYGYDRKTTPYLEKLIPTSLVAENAFPNAGNSTGSVTSLLTGKLPTETRVLYTPNTLTGSDAFQHLPGILRNLGYFTAEIGYTKYVDAYEVNMQDGFHLVNQRSLEDSRFFRFGRRHGYGDSFFFLTQIFERISDRLLHISFIQIMENPYDLVTENEHSFYVDDHKKVSQIIDLFKNTDEPLFIHVHLMGTHGPKFYPAQQVFSIGQEQRDHWMRDYYDDAILEFDSHVRRIFRRLEAEGKLDNTIVVIYTDHNMKYYTTQRVPLMFRFPKGEHAGRIHNNVQNIDIAPTLLDYLDIPVPDWMNGQSLLPGEPPRDRLIISGLARTTNPNSYRPPFYQFATISAVVCDQWYELRTQTSLLLTGSVVGHTSSCTGQDGLSRDAVRKQLLAHLQQTDFDVQSLPENYTQVLAYGAITRAQAALYSLKALHGTSYSPPPALGMFIDIPVSDPYAGWVEELVTEGLEEGCSSSPRQYCPDEILTRGQAAKLILMVKEGRGYVPPEPEGFYADVPPYSDLAPWVDELYRRGVSGECVAIPLSYCPAEPIDIEQFILYLNKIFYEP
jgi:arylsulfatase A-like enzyme